MRVEVGTTINRPAEEVFDFTTDPRKHAEWVGSVLSDSEISSGPIQVGTTFHEESKLLGRHLGEDWTVTAYERPRLYEQRTTIGGTEVSLRMTLTPEGEGTRVDVVTEAQGDVSGLSGRLFRLSAPVAARAIKTTQQADLETLKLILENRHEVGG